MQIHYLSQLPTLRELYAKPRDMARFEWYLEQMLGENEQGVEDVMMPITSANPMGREHCLVAVEALLAMGADQVAQSAFEEAARHFDEVDHTVRASVTLLDDVGGGGTNRFLMEAAGRMRSDERLERGNRQRRFVMVGCWASERYSPERIRAGAREGLYRYAKVAQQGVPRTLREIMRLDGAARAFAGERPALEEDELAYTQEVIAPYLDSSDFAVQFACLFGDAAAQSVGYAPQGFAPYAGFELALHLALQDSER